METFHNCILAKCLFFKWAIIGLFFSYFRPFQTAVQCLQQLNVKNDHQIYGAGIRTHDLFIISLLP